MARAAREQVSYGDPAQGIRGVRSHIDPCQSSLDATMLTVH